jgi:CBS domain containing-hemolysin-like protein
VAGIEVVDVAHAIQLAVAPVFLLSGVGVVLGVLIARLARIVDRARAAEDRVRHDAAQDTPEARAQLRVLARRARLINIAITLITITALLVSLVVALLFASTFLPINLAAYVAVLFVASMSTIGVGLLSFRREVRISIASLTFGTLAKKSPGFVARGE